MIGRMLNEEKFNELNKMIGYKEDQQSILMSNDYFDELKKLSLNGELKKNHIGFTYSYLFLQTYLFRYTRYDTYVPTTGDIKAILGYNPLVKGLDYIIKRNGLLDEVNLTKTLYDFPVVHNWEEGHLQFTMLSSLNDGGNAYGTKWREQHGVKTNQSCKYPVLGFYYDKNLFDEIILNDEGGTFFEARHCTMIDWNVFNYCMAHSELGVTGFYIYCYIKHKTDIHRELSMGINKLGEELMISQGSIKKYIKVLREYNLINTTLGKFIYGENVPSYLFESNKYKANSFDSFSYSKSELKKAKRISLEKHMKLIEQSEEICNLFG